MIQQRGNILRGNILRGGWDAKSGRGGVQGVIKDVKSGKGGVMTHYGETYVLRL